jgi:uncharacterized protein (DUF305 family)
VRDAAQRAEQAQVRDLASQMLTAQTMEVEVIRQMLAARGVAALPP